MIVHRNYIPAENVHEKPVNNRPRQLPPPSPEAAAPPPVARYKPVLPNTGLNPAINQVVQARSGLPLVVAPDHPPIPAGVVFDYRYIQPAPARAPARAPAHPPAPAPAPAPARAPAHAPAPAPARAPAHAPVPAPAHAPASGNRRKNRQAPPSGVQNRELYRNAANPPPVPHRHVNRAEMPNPYNDVALYGAGIRANKMRQLLNDYARSSRARDLMSNYDLRFIIFRHGERLDHVLGRDWYDKIFEVDDAPPEAFKHPDLPKGLPYRYPSLIYQYDPPLSANGQQKAMMKGQTFGQKGVKIDYCFSSPASRCVLTADAVLHGMNQRRVPICIDQHLFEPLNWNLPLKDLQGRYPFLTSQEWKRAGFNTDLSYPTDATHLRMYGSEHEYYDRSKHFFGKLVHQADTNTPPLTRRTTKQLTILIVGHAATAKTLENIALNRKPDLTNLFEQSKSVGYLYSTALFRNPKTHEWSSGGICN